jgi:hypothetical protein
VTAVDWRTEAWAVHIADEHQCCWIADPDNYDECGLSCGHDGGHTPHQVGAYLPPPLIGPLDLLPLQTTGLLRHCPLCGAGLEGIECGPALVFREGRFHDSEMETELIFWPCGCEGREILPGNEGGVRHG